MVIPRHLGEKQVEHYAKWLRTLKFSQCVFVKKKILIGQFKIQMLEKKDDQDINYQWYKEYILKCDNTFYLIKNKMLSFLLCGPDTAQLAAQKLSIKE